MNFSRECSKYSRSSGFDIFTGQVYISTLEMSNILKKKKLEKLRNWKKKTARATRYTARKCIKYRQLERSWREFLGFLNSGPVHSIQREILSRYTRTSFDSFSRSWVASTSSANLQYVDNQVSCSA